MDVYFIARFVGGTIVSDFVLPYNKQGNTIKWNAKFRSFRNLNPAVQYLLKLRSASLSDNGMDDFRLAHVHVGLDGTLTTEWMEV